MADLGGTLATAVGLFAGTNVDDIIVLTVLFLSARASGRPRPWQVWAGQYAGIAVLIAVSAVTALGLAIVPDRWVGFLGLVPFALGVRGLVRAIRARNEDEPPDPAVATGLLSVAGVTIANGADNISVYTPVFRTIGLTNSLITVAVFAVRRVVSRRIVAGLAQEGHRGSPTLWALDRARRVHGHRRGHRDRGREIAVRRTGRLAACLRASAPPLYVLGIAGISRAGTSWRIISLVRSPDADGFRS